MDTKQEATASPERDVDPQASDQKRVDMIVDTDIDNRENELKNCEDEPIDHFFFGQFPNGWPDACETCGHIRWDHGYCFCGLVDLGDEPTAEQKQKMEIAKKFLKA
jgi:hypothetical protein